MHITSVGNGAGLFCPVPRMQRDGKEVDHLAPNQESAVQFPEKRIKVIDEDFASVDVGVGRVIVSSFMGCVATQRLPILHEFETYSPLRRSMSFFPTQKSRSQK
jgi:hypothetical protein